MTNERWKYNVVSVEAFHQIIGVFIDNSMTIVFFHLEYFDVQERHKKEKNIY